MLHPRWKLRIFYKPSTSRSNFCVFPLHASSPSQRVKKHGNTQYHLLQCRFLFIEPTAAGCKNIFILINYLSPLSSFISHHLLPLLSHVSLSLIHLTPLCWALFLLSILLVSLPDRHGGAFMVEVVGLGSWWRSGVLGYGSSVMEVPSWWRLWVFGLRSWKSFRRPVGLGHGGCGGDGWMTMGWLKVVGD